MLAVSSQRFLRTTRRWLIIVGILSGLFCGWMLWIQYKTIDAYEVEQSTIRQYAQVQGEIQYFDEVLTMSSRMAILTNDPQWADRYQVFAPQLDTTIRHAQTLSQSATAQQAILHINEANQLLVGYEMNAMQYARQGSATIASNILFSPEYLAAKAQYADALMTLRQALDQDLTVLIKQRRYESLRIKLITLGLLIIIGASWLVLGIHLHQWRHQLSG